MEENNFPEINKKSPSIGMKLGDMAIKLTYENTMLYTFHSPYDGLNHIATELPGREDEAFYIFESAELIEKLREFKYPEVKYPYPCEEDIELFIDYSLTRLDDEFPIGEE